jgi:hypothetical protein
MSQAGEISRISVHGGVWESLARWEPELKEEKIMFESSSAIGLMLCFL